MRLIYPSQDFHVFWKQLLYLPSCHPFLFGSDLHHDWSEFPPRAAQPARDPRVSESRAALNLGDVGGLGGGKTLKEIMELMMEVLGDIAIMSSNEADIIWETLGLLSFLPIRKYIGPVDIPVDAWSNSHTEDDI